MTQSNVEVWAEISGALVAAALLPFYMGFLHLTLLQLLLYTAVAGTLLTLGEQMRFRHVQPFQVRDFIADLPMWTGLVLGLGLVAYVAALLLI